MQSQFRFGGKGHLFRDAYASTPLSILCPSLRQVEARTERPGQGLARAGIIDHILGTDHELAVALFAQRARVLVLHADRRLALFRQADIIEHQHAVGWAPLD
jgi:hypothetical protein